MVFKKKKEPEEPLPLADVSNDTKAMLEKLLGEEGARVVAVGPNGNDPTSGVEVAKIDQWTVNKLLDIYFSDAKEKPELIKYLTLINPQQFNTIVIGDTFDEAITEGSSRKESIWKKFMRNRDVRARALGGEWAKSLLHLHDAKMMGEQSQSNDGWPSMKMGGD